MADQLLVKDEKLVTKDGSLVVYSKGCSCCDECSDKACGQCTFSVSNFRGRLCGEGYNHLNVGLTVSFSEGLYEWDFPPTYKTDCEGYKTWCNASSSFNRCFIVNGASCGNKVSSGAYGTVGLSYSAQKNYGGQINNANGNTPFPGKLTVAEFAEQWEANPNLTAKLNGLKTTDWASRYVPTGGGAYTLQSRDLSVIPVEEYGYCDRKLNKNTQFPTFWAQATTSGTVLQTRTIGTGSIIVSLNVGSCNWCKTYGTNNGTLLSFDIKASAGSNRRIRILRPSQNNNDYVYVNGGEQKTITSGWHRPLDCSGFMDYYRIAII